MRDWYYFDKFYAELTEQDVYEQPDETGRIAISKSVIEEAPIGNIESVLDVGCGYGYAQELFPNTDYVGITCSEEEYKKARELGRVVLYADYNFIRLGREFDLVFSSHSLEHSPFPLLTLMEWHRVGENLLLIVPNPEHYGYIGKNHYSVATSQQVRWWLRRAGWKVVWSKNTGTDMAFFANRLPRIGSEGWSEIDYDVYIADRDNKTTEEVAKERRGE
jgi:SAM-dependent methyltransferase